MKKYTLKEKIVIEFKNDYVQFDSSLKWNWFCFNVVQIHFEKDMMCGPAYEFLFYLLGLGIFIRYNTDEAMESFEVMMKESKESLALTKEEFYKAIEEYDERV